MEMRSESAEDYIIISPAGRLDGHGAGLLQQVLTAEMSDSVRSVIFDLKEAPYISSAGIRVFILARNRAKSRSGRVILCNVSEFPLNVLKMAGMDRVFPVFADRADAVAALKDTGCEKATGLHHQPSGFQYEDLCVEVQPLGTGTATLNVIGSLTKVLHSDISPDDLRQIRFSDCEYSLGLGALAEDAEAARHLLGEMITLHGSIVWLPTDGNNVPDFFTPVRDTGGVAIFSGFAATLEGQFHDLFRFHSEKPGGVTLSQVYRSIFRYAEDAGRSDRPGIVAIALIGRSCGIRSSGIIHPPIPEKAPGNGRSIVDPANLDSWFEVIGEPCFAGETLVAFGIGVDLQGDLSAFAPEELSSLYYLHPANKGSQTEYLHTHGVVFRSSPLNREEDIGREIRRLLITGEFLDMRHLMDDTRITDIRCAAAYISAIRNGDSTG
jgi:anti-anti-sigma factor